MILPSKMSVILQINSHIHVGILFLMYKLHSHDIFVNIIVHTVFLAPIIIIELHLAFYLFYFFWIINSFCIFKSLDLLYIFYITYFAFCSKF